jgi:L-fuconolactonase
VTEADWNAWAPSDLTPYLDTVFEAFGVERLMWGSDWPVCGLAADYARVARLLDPILTLLPQKSRDAILGGNALKFYSIP